MQNTYTTQTRVDKNHCIIDVYRNHECWFTYDFHLEQLYLDSEGTNIFTQIAWKNWGTSENIKEIHNSIVKYLLYK